MVTEEHLNPKALVEDHGDYLLSFAMSKIHDLELSKDLVQDTFISAMENLDSFEKRSKVRTWLTSILHRKIIDYWRKAETRYTDPISSFFHQEGDHQSWILERISDRTLTVEAKIAQEETYQELRECLDTLPAKWKSIVSSKYFDEKETDQICNDFDIRPSNFWVIVHRSKLILRDCLKKKWMQS